MTCEELRADYAVYALGILEEPACAEITDHLLRRCEQCVPGVASAMATVSAMSGAVNIAEPPADLRRRVIAMVDRRGSETARNGWRVFLPWGIAAALAVALVALVLPFRSLNQNAAKLENAFFILNDPATRELSFGSAQQTASGHLFVHATRGVVLMAAHLPRIGSGKIFELWVIPSSGNPIPAGTFSSSGDDSAMYVRPGPVEPKAAALAVTVEPGGGSALPTTRPFLVVNIGS